jgi:hypothetical protein
MPKGNHAKQQQQAKAKRKGKPKAKPKPPAVGSATGMRPATTKAGKVIRALASVPAVRGLDKAFLGGAAGKIFDALTGSGDYTVEAATMPYEVSANTVLHTSMTPAVPRMHEDAGATRIRHREFLGNVTMTAGFSNSPFRVQPGDQKTFPWLAPIARLYQQYKFLGVVFEFVTNSGVFNATSPALGSVIMATQYNVTQPVFANQINMLNTYFACSGVPSVSLMHALECDPAEQPYQLYYVRNPLVAPQPTVDPGGASYNVRDPRLFDFAIFQYASFGGPVASYPAGQLWVTYEVMLYKPVVPDIGFGVPPLISDEDRKSFGMPTQAEDDRRYAEKKAQMEKSSKSSKRSRKSTLEFSDNEDPPSRA